MASEEDGIERAWISLSNYLNNYDYWKNTKVEKWSVIDYYISVINQDPTITRYLSKRALLRDLDVIAEAFPDHKTINSKTGTLKTGATIDKKDVLSLFWSQKASSLRTLALSRKIRLEEVTDSLESTATSSIVTRSKRQLQQPPPAATKKTKVLPHGAKTKNVESPTLKPNREIKEVDMVGIPGCSLSVGTIIKREALKIYMENVDTLDKLTARKRKILTAGLSSILDLSDHSFNSQRLIFTEEQWSYLNDYFNPSLKIDRVELDKDVTDTLVVVSNLLQLSGNFKAAKKYISAMEDKAEFNTTFQIAFELLMFTLTLLQRYQYLFENPSKVNIRENDFLRLVWSPIFEILFPPEGKIRLVAAESINALSTEAKKQLYPESKYIHGFKIDMRLVIDLNRKEIDLAVGECAKNNEDNKAVADSSKLVRESKETVDGHVQLIDDSNFHFKAYSLQCTGTSCIVTTTELVGNGLYVTLLRDSFALPSNVSDWQNMGTTLIALLTMRKELTQCAAKILQSHALQTPSTTEKSFNRSSIPPVNNKLAWIRDTWHTPPAKTQPRLPSSFYTTLPKPAPPILKEIPGSNHEEGSSSGSNQPDVYGLIKIRDDCYYNVFLKKYFDKHPVNDQ